MTTPYSSYGATGQSAYPASQSTPAQAASTGPYASMLSTGTFGETPATPGTPTPVGRGRPRGASTGAKRGRKPRGALVAGASAAASPRPFVSNTFGTPSATSPTIGATSTPSSFVTGAAGSSSAANQYGKVHWATPGPDATGSTSTTPGPTTNGATPIPNVNGSTSSATTGAPGDNSSNMQSQDQPSTSSSAMVIDPALMGPAGTIPSVLQPASNQRGTTGPDGATASNAAALLLASRGLSQPPGAGPRLSGVPGIEEEGEGDDELLPAMADDDYSAQLSWQSQSKDNLKVLMDNLSPAQYDRFEAYRRHALPKQAVIQQTLGQQVSQPVAQIIAGFSKVFVGEIVEKARAVQARRGETGPLSPDHLREAYRMYQQETGHVGAARPLRAKKLFVK
ncbi:hypothetical protein CVT26_016173 [Gymnopilus dilepis]|uniref:TAFII28-like protein domain-containing protein n=1 Tax=Gymnopilus dilepis TaxID=231916 RepID=A0A409XZ68_9AGAR|nr:hypothetical protein CVT26_016173 [Gymnopilus dilepis]